MKITAILTSLLVASASAFAPQPAFSRSSTLFAESDKKTGVVKWYVRTDLQYRRIPACSALYVML